MPLWDHDTEEHTYWDCELVGRLRAPDIPDPAQLSCLTGPAGWVMESTPLTGLQLQQIQRMMVEINIWFSEREENRAVAGDLQGMMPVTLTQ